MDAENTLSEAEAKVIEAFNYIADAAFESVGKTLFDLHKLGVRRDALDTLLLTFTARLVVQRQLLDAKLDAGFERQRHTQQ